MGVKTRKLSQINDSLIEWQSVIVADGSTGLTAVAGRGYFINTTGGAITVTFPASPKIGDTIILNDYASTFNTNNVTINFNGNKLEADTTNAILSTNDQTHTFVFTDTTQGWKIVNQDTGTAIQPLFISATGGTITTSGDFKIHSFTGDGCFVVSTAGNPVGSDKVDYLVVAGGGGGAKGCSHGAGGGAGGFREGRVLPAPESYTASPLVAPAGLPVSVQSYPITVGAGGAARTTPAAGNPGNSSTFSTITSSGGGGGGNYPGGAGLPGGSGGGGSANPSSAAGSGNTPPVSPPQGNSGGTSTNNSLMAGGGGATAVGVNAPGPAAGGAGATTSISASPTAYAGGGGGGGTGAPGGLGGGGAGSGSGAPGTSGTVNTGGGGGGQGTGNSGAGGSGIVIIRYKFQ